MTIIWHGQSCFEIITTPAKNSQIKIVIDPFSEEIGFKVPKLEADILLVTHSHRDHNNVKAVSGSPFLISGPGEYEIKNVFIQGIHSWHDNSRGQEGVKIPFIPLSSLRLTPHLTPWLKPRQPKI